MQGSRQSKRQGSQRTSAHSNAALPSEQTTRLPKGQCTQQCSSPVRGKNKAPKGPVPTATQGSHQSKRQGSQRASADSNAVLPSEGTTRLPKGQCPQQRSAPIRANNKDPKGSVPTAPQQRSSQREQQGSQRVSAHSNAVLPSEQTTRLSKDQCPQQCRAPVRANKAPKESVPTATQRSHQSEQQGSQRVSAHSTATALPSAGTTRLPKDQCPQQCSAPIRANNKDPKGPVPTATQRSRQSKQQGSQRASAHSNAGLPSERTTRLPKDQCPQQRSAPIRANNKALKGPVPTATQQRSQTQRARQSEQQGSLRTSAHSSAALLSERTTRLPKGLCPQQRSAPIRANNKALKGPVPTATQRSRQSEQQGSERASAHSNAGLPSERMTRLPKGQCPQQHSAPGRANNKAPKGSVPTATQRSHQSEKQGSERASAHSKAAALPSEGTTRLPKDQCPQQRSAPIRANDKAPKGAKNKALKGPVPTAKQQRSPQREQQGSLRTSAHSSTALPSEQTRLPKGQCPQQRSAPIRANKAPKGPVPTATQRSRQSKQQGSQRAIAHSNAALPSEQTTRIPKGQCPQQRSAPIRANDKAPKGSVPTATQRSHQSERQGSQRASAHSNAALPSEQTTRLPKGQCPQQCSTPIRANNKDPKGPVPTATQRSHQSKRQGSQRVSAHSNAALPSERTTRIPKGQCPQQRWAHVRANKAPKGPVPTATQRSRQSKQQGSQRDSAHSNAGLPSEQTTRLPEGQCPQQRSAPVRANNKAPKGSVPIAAQHSRQSK
ncbi:hypothetical protein NDU88_000018 [Pleurodeles waltl]|uniref:Uncharacterized protein n=1 Tax=Pleurodeles waltl TaxID=8319 RepID=A0AAV7SV94_PLEWA|nr:hypothetical protein NDU88_000018 [Pleurodeles waltl]